MDGYIKRIKQLLFLAVISGIYSTFAILDLTDFRRTYLDVEKLFASYLMTHEEYVGELTPENMSPNFLENAPDELWDAMKQSSPPAANYIGESTEAVGGFIRLRNGLRYAFRLYGTVLKLDDEELLTSGALPNDGETHDLTEPLEINGFSPVVEDMDAYLRGKESNCGEFSLRTSTTERNWAISCFSIWKEGAEDRSIFVWVVDGRAYETPFDVFKTEGTFFVDERGARSAAEGAAEFFSSMDQVSQSEADIEKAFLSVRQNFLNYKIRLPVLAVDAELDVFLIGYSIISAIIGIFLLHAVLVLSEKNLSSHEEPWILILPQGNGRADSALKKILFYFGISSFVLAVFLPLAPILIYLFFFGLSLQTPYFSLIVAAFELLIAALTLLYLRQALGKFYGNKVP